MARDKASERRTKRPAPDEEPVSESPVASRQVPDPSPESPVPSPRSPVPGPQDEGSDGAEGSEADEGSEGDEGSVALRRERDEYLALAQRAQADFENYRKRAAKEAAAAGDRAKSGLVRELLPVVDNLERALGSAEESEQHLAEGVRLVHSELVAVLQRNGVEPFDPQGESFDPTLHEALSTRSEEGADAGVVLDVVEKGYKLNGTVLRPARVVVSG